jgi:lipopolysaccharide/colanic/teichoic acid biosynthesis glycosyltransferase
VRQQPVTHQRGIIRRLTKRCIDIVVSAAGLVVSSPLLFAVGVAIRLKMGPPSLFRQKRVGRGERIFTLYKFRTMRQERRAEEQVTSDHIRVTPLGSALRSTSLDELPSLWNVLKGDMSLVGPRPLLPEYLPLYTEQERRRHDVRPGMTGLAQVSGRQDLTFRQRFALDVEYVENQSLALDVKILARTLAAVLFSRGVKTGQSFAEVDDIGALAALSVSGSSDAHEHRPGT